MNEQDRMEEWKREGRAKFKHLQQTRRDGFMGYDMDCYVEWYVRAMKHKYEVSQRAKSLAGEVC